MPQTIAKRRAAKGTHANRPPSKKAQPRRATEKVSVDEQGVRWLAAANGYEVALAGGKLAARNSKGKRLASVPPAGAQSEVGERLLALRDWLAQHERQCTETVETWMLRSLPVPRDVVQAVWPDPAWRRPLENLVVVPVKDGALELGSPGFLRGADPSKGVGVVNLDGETAWIRSEEVAVAHPILLPDLDDLRNMAAELKLTQG